MMVRWLTTYDLKHHLHHLTPRDPPLRAEESYKRDEPDSFSHQALGELQMLLEQTAFLLSPELQSEVAAVVKCCHAGRMLGTNALAARCTQELH